MKHGSDKFDNQSNQLSNGGVYENKSFVDYGKVADYSKHSSLKPIDEMNKQNKPERLVQHAIEPDDRHAKYAELHYVRSSEYWEEVATDARALSLDERDGKTVAEYTRTTVQASEQAATKDLMQGLDRNSMLARYYLARIDAEIEHPRRKDERTLYAFTPEPDVTVDDYVSHEESSVSGRVHNSYEIIDAMHSDAKARPGKSFAFVRHGGAQEGICTYDVYEVDASPDDDVMCYDATSEEAAALIANSRKIGSYEPVDQRERYRERDVMDRYEEKPSQENLMEKDMDINKSYERYNDPYIQPRQDPRPSREYPDIISGDDYDDGLER